MEVSGVVGPVMGAAIILEAPRLRNDREEKGNVPRNQSCNENGVKFVSRS